MTTDPNAGATVVAALNNQITIVIGWAQAQTAALEAAQQAVVAANAERDRLRLELDEVHREVMSRTEQIAQTPPETEGIGNLVALVDEQLKRLRAAFPAPVPAVDIPPAPDLGAPPVSATAADPAVVDTAAASDPETKGGAAAPGESGEVTTAAPTIDPTTGLPIDNTGASGQQ